MAVALLILISASTLRARAQTGYNIVQQGGSTLASSSFIDASAFSGSDFCARVYAAISYSTGGRVVDARGLNSSNTNMTCTSGTPWVQGSNSTTHPTDLLLPAGTIVIPSTWIIPSQTSVIGEGTGRL